MHPSEVHWTKDAPAGRFTQSEHEFLETVVLNLKHRLLLYSCILYCCAHVHTRTHSPILRLTQVHSCLSVHTHILYLGEYLLPTTHTQVPLVSIKDTEIHLLTGLNTCIQTNSVHENCLHMHKRMNLGTRGILREAWSACVPRCCGVSQGQLSVHAYVEVGVGEGGVPGACTGAGLSPSTLLHSLHYHWRRAHRHGSAKSLATHWLLGCHGLRGSLQASPERLVCKRGAGLLRSTMFLPAQVHTLVAGRHRLQTSL